MIPFAGFDPKEPPLEPVRRVAKPKAPRKPKSATYTPFQSRSARAYLMFSLGQDTLDIAEVLKCPEAHVLRWISIERSKAKGLPTPYGVIR